ncbi:D-beta-hydroxybutyrate dehydrogenase, mitochondrial-like [Mercenaria mercenaria]|uniref:D-beta-hydroxybutyrate dehydrogenase, mitochondrial-like n=1 Tax=Mercenaria mercenaria TaxID=6596 RepID=UPI00234E8B26|nr:D-beta-hydroxybutyrate dehydrogenase, mitochondrial-like [Mercenaria mercenaria]
MDIKSTETLIFSAYMLACILLFYYIIIEVYLYFAAIIVLYVLYRILSKQYVTKLEIKGQGVFITGCDTGIGHATALRLVKAGFTVFAGCLKPEDEGATALMEKGGERLHVVPLDVTSDESVQHAFEMVKTGMPETGLWAVINNAGIEFAAEIEFATIEMMKRVAEVNFYGIVRVTKTFLPLLRKSKGRVVNVTSVKGRLGCPADSAYTCAKWAGEAFSDILRREMYRFGVNVVIIEPGQFGNLTQILQGERLRLAEDELNKCWELASEEIQEAYGRECIDGLIKDFRDDSKSGPKSLDAVTEAMLDAVENVNPKCRYLVHGTNMPCDKYCITAVLNQYLPEYLMDYIYGWIVPLPPVKQQVK